MATDDEEEELREFLGDVPSSSPPSPRPRKRARAPADDDEGDDDERPRKRARAPQNGIDPVTGVPMDVLYATEGEEGAAPRGPQFESFAAVSERVREDARRQAEAETVAVDRDRVEDDNFCILCSFGHHSFDGSDAGFRLFDEMVQMMLLAYMYCRPQEAVRIGRLYYETRLRREFDRAGHLAPPFNVALVYEHMTTQRHTICNRFFPVQQIRMLSEMQAVYLAEVRDTKRGLSTEKGKLIISLSEKIRTFYKEDPAQWMYGPPTAGESAPGTATHPSITHAIREGVRQGAMSQQMARWFSANVG